LGTDDRQFGFKKDLGCSNAIFAVRSTVDYFNDRGSTVYTAALDISKAYDRVSHYKLFTALLHSGIPKWVILLIVDWYSKLSVAVRWHNCYSAYFPVGSGLRQGSSLSPSLFNVFINIVISELKSLNLGCYIHKTWIGCVVYADDIILLSASLTGLQTMLDKCSTVISDLRLNFNCNKSVCVAFGKHSASQLADVNLNNTTLQWSHSLKYLGVNFKNGCRMNCDIDYITRKFYAASNCIFNNSSGLDDLLQLHLQSSYCLPILQYASPALHFNKNQLRALNVCWNDVYRRIFKFNRWESVSEFIWGLGCLNFTHLWYLSVVKFIKSLLLSSNSVMYGIVNNFIHGIEYITLIKEIHVSHELPMYVIRESVSTHFSNAIVH
jgi:Reverse transcriptase (RNA-dependent DNA polymerase)